ncbi:hypothetical protein ZYGR_0AG04990 [Zygosaccharomyces rouxii]|uniref:U5 small nuclear ribonucleoprotein 200 kDa helicase n=1 Tax=Zygosaccharomyces rouxii TaxID=4956 RepID=A0A1Q3AA45_ZYGRO|nr:hypothetical protein ZYGR_0AG04990 [Zygosaccharomyces rouxii]
MSRNDNDYEDDKRQKIRELYRHDEMSSKVLEADKRFLDQRGDPIRDAEESQPKSMRGRISVKDMGVNADHKVPDEEKLEARKEVDVPKRQNHGRKMASQVKSNGILDGNYGLKYYPSDEANMQIYEEILNWVTDLFGSDIPHDVIVETADLLIFTLKDKEKDQDGKVDVQRGHLESDLGVTITVNKFQELLKLTNQISDYNSNKGSSNDSERAVPILMEDQEEEGDANSIRGGEGMNEDEDEDDEEEETTARSFDMRARHETLPKKNNETMMIQGSSDRKFEDLNIQDIDEFFLRRMLLKEMEDVEATDVQALSDAIFTELTKNQDDKTLESRLMRLLDFSYLSLIGFFVKKRDMILWGIRLAQAPELKKQDVLREMSELGLHELVEQYEQKGKQELKRRNSHFSEEDMETNPKRSKTTLDSKQVLPLIDLGAAKFDQSSRLMTVTKIRLPEGSYKKLTPHYEEIYIPAPKKIDAGIELVPISVFPSWAQNAFPSAETESLNPIQSKLYPVTFGRDDNVLLCAPTGAGKTNVAMMAILRTISKHINVETGRLTSKNFKIVYIAPLKALVQEQVSEFQRRLSYMGIKVAELTGDSNLNRQQLLEAQILISTPEKWDVITRKADESSFVQSVRLMIIDEIHLLHDARGPVIEAIVSRALQGKTFQEPPRLLGLSATLPNYQDVSKFLRVPDNGLFYFDSSFRPCPLSQQFCGVTEKSSLKKLNAMNETCHEKTLEAVKQGHQVIIFVYSRKETARTALWLIEKLSENDNLGLIRKSDPASRKILETESDNVQDGQLKKIIQAGIGIHHAGLTKSDRSLSEDLFADGLLQVLVSTATLAWGVNLPAHTVIVKGTDVYSPESGLWEPLSPQDLLQMLGRAGRPRYDTNGEGIIITNQTDVQFYLAVLNQQLPIESQLVSKIVDNLNAEVVAGNIQSRKDGVDWLTYTYLYVRMLMSPDIYKVPETERENDTLKYGEALIHSAMAILHEENLVVYDAESGNVEATELGRISSYFYINHTSMQVYDTEITQHSTQIDLFRVISLSDEFKHISVRQEEKQELKALLEKCPIPIREDASDSLAKVNVLLQSYVSRLRFEGFALNADMVFITQNAGRLFRAIYELCLKKNWSNVTKLLLNLCKTVDRRMWIANSPLRQFKTCPSEVIRRTEASTLPWSTYLELQSPGEVGQAIRSEKHGKLVHDLLRRFPKLSAKCAIQPITPSLLRFELEVLPDWVWDERLHGNAEPFIVMLEDTDGERILYSDSLLIRKEYIGLEHFIDFSLILTPAQQKRLPPNFFVTILSERWCQCENQISIGLEPLCLPRKFPAPTPLADMLLISTSDLENEEFTKVFDFENFNKFQSQVFQPLYTTNENVLVGASKGSGKTVMAELAILNHWRQNKGRALYISPHQYQIDKVLKSWKERFSALAGGKSINKLGSDLNFNLKVIAQSHLILATPDQFDLVSRRWRNRRNIQRIELAIYDDVQEISGGMTGAVYETVISRMTFISTQLEKDTRFVALGSCLANGRDFGEWIGASRNNIFNFSPQEKLYPMEVHLHAFETAHNTVLNVPMTKYAFNFAQEHQNDNILIFSPSRKSCINSSMAFIQYAFENNLDFLRAEEEDLNSYLKALTDDALKKSLTHGIGIIYAEMNAKDRTVVEKLHDYGAISILLVTKDCSYNCPSSNKVIILGTQYYEGKEHRYVDYSANQLLEMVNSTKGNTKDDKTQALVLTNHKMKDYYKKFLSEGLPIESFMFFHLYDALTSEINTSVIQTKQDCVDWIAYTFFYRRIHANPSFYGVKDVSAYGISAYLTELVENTLRGLQECDFIELRSDEKGTDEDIEEIITPLNACAISSHHNTSFLTMHTLLNSLSANSTLKDILQVLSRASEFENLPLRPEDEPTLLKLYNQMPIKISSNNEGGPISNKILLLLQAYFSRTSLPIELQWDVQIILQKAVPLVNSTIDILSSDGCLNATTGMDISQMLIQGVWDTDNPLKQIPFFDGSILKKCEQKGVETVYDVMALEDDERNAIMTMDNRKLVKVANFINNFPNIELEYSLDTSKPLTVGEYKEMEVTLTRDEAPETLLVTSEKYPHEKLEGWWLVIGEISTKQLYATKKVSLSKETQSYTLDFTVNQPGKHELTLWCVCDSYIDADKEVSFEVEAV